MGPRPLILDALQDIRRAAVRPYCLKSLEHGTHTCTHEREVFSLRLQVLV